MSSMTMKSRMNLRMTKKGNGGRSKITGRDDENEDGNGDGYGICVVEVDHRSYWDPMSIPYSRDVEKICETKRESRVAQCAKKLEMGKVAMA